MTYYQPTVEIFRYSILKGKWVQKELHPSTLIFHSLGQAEMYKHTFLEGLERRGIKLKRGHYQIFNAQLIAPENDR